MFVGPKKFERTRTTILKSDKTTDDFLLLEGTIEKIKDAIVDRVKRSDGPVKPSELAKWLGIQPLFVKKLCDELIKEGSLGTKPRKGE